MRSFFLYVYTLVSWLSSDRVKMRTKIHLNHIPYNQSQSHPLFIRGLHVSRALLLFEMHPFCVKICASDLPLPFSLGFVELLHCKFIPFWFPIFSHIRLTFRREHFKDIPIWSFRVNVKLHACFFIISLASKLLKYTFQYTNILFKNSPLLHYCTCENVIHILPPWLIREVFIYLIQRGIK